MNDLSLQVVLQRCGIYNRTSVTATIEAAFLQLGRIGGLHGKIVLLKPNLISGSGSPLACTRPEFIAGVAAFLYVTLAVKNLFGIVKGVNKAMLHMVHGATHHGFAEIILDLLDILPPQMHLADGIMVMHHSGPLDGEPLPLYCIAAAESAVAMDTALLQVLELDPRNSSLWQAATARKLAGSDAGSIGYPALSPKEFHGSGFIAPSSLNPIRLNPLRFLRGLVKRVMLRIRA